MCMGDSGLDTLDTTDQGLIREAAAGFPTHAFSVRSNEDGINWVVLEPSRRGPAMLRFTICRVDPCFMVMAEDAAACRQFCTASSVEDALGFVRLLSDQAMLAVMNAHPASLVLQ